MKILFIGSKKFDYLEDLTYSGLVKKFGISNIIELNWSLKKHLNYYNYPKNISFVEGNFFKSFFNRFKREFDIVFVASCREDAFKSYLNIIDNIPTTTPTVFLDGGDREEIGGDLIRGGYYNLYEKAIEKREFTYIFKREYLEEKEYAKNIFPLPFSFNFDRLPYLDAIDRYDVSFWAVESHEIRTKALKILENKFDCKENGTVLNQVFSKYDRKGDRYLQELARCKIALNLRGSGWDTLRYWEVPAVSRLMISQKPQIVIPNNFREGREVIFCRDDLSDLEELCTYYLQNSDKREEMSKNAFNYAKEFHSDVARVEYILEKIVLN